MSAKPNLRTRAEEIATAQNQMQMLPVIQKELIHYEILNALDKKGVLEELTFQGGTCLRLCYGSPRYSEDLDFTYAGQLDEAMLTDIKDDLERMLMRHYDVEVSLKALKSLDTDVGVTVNRWRFDVTTDTAHRDVPRQKVKLEIAEVPSYTRVVKPLIINYEGLPLSYSDILVVAQTITEICADKIVSFASASHIRNRDIWDLRWLSRRPDLDESQLPGLVSSKLTDYGDEQAFTKGLDRVFTDLPKIIEGADFMNQMTRFLPYDLREQTIANKVFRDHMVEEIRRLYNCAGFAHQRNRFFKTTI